MAWIWAVVGGVPDSASGLDLRRRMKRIFDESGWKEGEIVVWLRLGDSVGDNRWTVRAVA